MHLAVVAFTVIAMLLILIFGRFRFDKRSAKPVSPALDTTDLCVSNVVDSYLFLLFDALKVLRPSRSE
jgi:hypothetical protein